MADSVARLKATLTLDDDGFIRGMSDASGKLDAYNAKLKEQGVSSRLATMASKDYAKQLFNEARQVDQTEQAHGRLFRTMQFGQRHWKALSIGAVSAGVGVMALTGHLGTLTGVASHLGTTVLPLVTSATQGAIVPFTALTAVAVGLAGPLSALVTLFGAIGGGAAFGLYSALTSNNKAFNDLQNRVGNMKHMFGDLGDEIGKRLLPHINSGVTAVEQFIKYADKLAHMSLPNIIHSISTQGMSMLEHINKSIYNLIGRPIEEIFKGSFGNAGNRISGAFAKMLDVWKPLVGHMWTIFTSWFNKQHFTAIGAQWAAAIVQTAVPVIARGLFHALEATFQASGLGGKIGEAIAIGFAANLLSGGLLTKIGGALLGGGGLGGLLKKGLVGGGAGVAAGEGAGGAVAGGGLVGTVGIGAIAAAVIPAAVVAFAAYESSHSKPLTPQQRQNQLNPPGPTSVNGVPTVKGYGQARFGSLITQNDIALAKQYTDALKRVSSEEKDLNDNIKHGSETAGAWRKDMQQATNQADAATKATKGLADNGFLSTQKAAAQQKGTLAQYINQMQTIAGKATTASHNTSGFGASARAQEGHVAALASTAAQLARAIGSIPSQKYVSIVVSIIENLKSQGNAPGQTPTGIHADGGVITGGVPNKDSVRSLLMPGEVVLSKKAIANYFGGDPYAANSMNFATGGVVPPPGGFPTSVIDAPVSFHKPSWFHGDSYYNHRIHEDKAHIRAIERTIARLKKEKPVPTKKIKMYEDSLRRQKNKERSAKAGRAGNSPRLAQWIENQVSNLAGRMEFNEQTWDNEYQRTGDTSWFDKEQKQRLEEIHLYERAAKFDGTSPADKIAFKEAAVGLYEDYQNGVASTPTAGQQSAANVAEFLSQQASFIDRFTGNVMPFGPPPSTMATQRGNSLSTTAGGVTVVQNITMTDPDPFHLARRASFAAQAAM